MSEKMTVTQGLNELKILDSRINRAIAEAKFVTSAKICDKNVTSSMSKEDFEIKAKASLQSCDDLIERRKKIKSAIVTSNAVTKVNIAGKEMTVAEAIERKVSIEYEKNLLNQMRIQYTSSALIVDKRNTEMEASIEKLVNTAFGKESKVNIKEDDYSSIADPYRKSNEYGLVDPINIQDEIMKRSEELDSYLTSVDTSLQISNCTTIIEIE